MGEAYPGQALCRPCAASIYCAAWSRGVESESIGGTSDLCSSILWQLSGSMRNVCRGSKRSKSIERLCLLWSYLLCLFIILFVRARTQGLLPGECENCLEMMILAVRRGCACVRVLSFPSKGEIQDQKSLKPAKKNTYWVRTSLTHRSDRKSVPVTVVGF